MPVINVIGTAGIGKSRLVKELLSSVDEEASVLVGRCLPYGKGITYWPLRDLVRRGRRRGLTRSRSSGLLEGEPDASKVAARIAGAIGIAEAARAPRTRRSGRSAGCSSACPATPARVGFDDLQWAEPTFLDLIEYLLGWIRDAPILIVCIARPDLLEQASRLARRRRRTQPRSRSRPLSEQEAESLLELLRGEAELSSDLFTQITEAAEGNPLFVEQMLAMMTEDGSAAHDRRFRRRSTLCSPPASTASSPRSGP